MEYEKRPTREHHHKGKSSERLLDKTIIIRELGIHPGQIILDAGCGNGYMSKLFSEAVGSTGKVFALDPDEESIAALRSETVGTNIEAIVGDISTTTELEKSSIDLIYVSTVLHGFSAAQVRGFRDEVKRLLKPGARLAIIEIEKRPTPFGPPLDIRFSPEELQQALPLASLDTVQVGEYFYLQMFENRVES
ncbi:MAG: class I SAM-dependent methyltransferase [Desulfobacca sp.]|nr:class I SAM-dependent methyltransferase [Desulfobacca sp.]